MDCGVQVDAGKPLIIAEDRSKTLTEPRQNVRKQAIHQLKWLQWRWRAGK